MKNKITIKAEIPEQEFMECLLNMKSSGYDVILPLVFYAFAHSWHIDKLNYYLELLEVEYK